MVVSHIRLFYTISLYIAVATYIYVVTDVYSCMLCISVRAFYLSAVVYTYHSSNYITSA